MRILKPYCLLFTLLGILLFPHVVLAQKTYTVSGYIKEGETGEDMISATVYIKELLKGTTTNLYGFYSITVPEGNYNLIVSYLGFDIAEYSSGGKEKNMESLKWEIQESEKDLLKVVKNVICQLLLTLKNLEIVL